MFGRALLLLHNSKRGHGEVSEIELMRSTKVAKDQHVDNPRDFRDSHAGEAKPRLKELQKRLGIGAIARLCCLYAVSFPAWFTLSTARRFT